MAKKPQTEIRSDIVIIGGGAAGLAAALTARENGAKKIILLEARQNPGGNSAFAEGFFTLNPRPEKPVNVRQLKDRLMQKAWSFTHHQIDFRLVSRLIDESVNTLNWLEGKGFQFEWKNIFHGDEIPLYASEIKAKKKTGAVIIQGMAEACRGQGVEIRCQTRARKLITDGSGKVAGVTAESPEGSIDIHAAAVIIATGGFGGNQTLLRRYVPSYTEDIKTVGVPNQGDGLLMAAEVGADTQDEVVLEMEGPAFPWTRELSLEITSHYNTVWVNKKGVRFAPEQFNPFECANSLNRQPGKVSWTLMDEDIKDRIANEMEASVNTRLDSLIQSHVEKDHIKIANSWEEIARWAGIPPNVLEATIREYNGFCAHKRDNHFQKNPDYLQALLSPPFYAIPCSPTILVTHGGIKINLGMAVLDKYHEPIPGLFAAGIDTGGSDGDTYNYNLPGHSFGFALSTGRLAGQEAAKDVRKESSR